MAASAAILRTGARDFPADAAGRCHPHRHCDLRAIASDVALRRDLRCGLACLALNRAWFLIDRAAPARGWSRAEHVATRFHLEDCLAERGTRHHRRHAPLDGCL